MYELLLLLRNSHHNVAAVAVDVASKVDSQCTWPVTVEAIRRAVAVAVASKRDSASLLTGESIHRTVAVAVAFDVADVDFSAVYVAAKQDSFSLLTIPSIRHLLLLLLLLE